MHTSLLLAASALAAGTVLPRQSCAAYPPTSSSRAFDLVINVTDPSRDWPEQPVHGHLLGSIHVGPPYRRAVATPPPAANETTRPYFLNGTADEPGLVLIDLGFPYGIRVEDQAFDEGSPVPWGSEGPGQDVYVLPFINEWFAGMAGGEAPRVVNRRRGGSYMVCNRTVPYYRSVWTVVDYAYAIGEVEDSGVPGECVPVSLVPQCAELPAVLEGSTASYEFAKEQRCYEDVVTVDWSVYR